VPNRILYDLDRNNGEFDRSTDLQVFVSDRGAIGVVPVENAQINIIENPGSIAQSRFPLRPDGTYLFLRPGRKLVEVAYNNMVTRYSIEVRGTDFGGGDDDFTDIIWFATVLTVINPPGSGTVTYRNEAGIVTNRFSPGQTVYIDAVGNPGFTPGLISANHGIGVISGDSFIMPRNGSVTVTVTFEPE